MIKLAMTYAALPQLLATNGYATRLERFSGGDGITLKDALRLVDLIRHQSVSDCVFVVGSASALNYLSQHKQPTRFYSLGFIVAAEPALPMAQRWLSIWNAELDQAKCTYVVVAHRASTLEWLSGDSAAALEFRRFLKRYEVFPQSGVHGATVYRLIA
jgi:hypothetical protein